MKNRGASEPRPEAARLAAEAHREGEREMTSTVALGRAFRWRDDEMSGQLLERLRDVRRASGLADELEDRRWN